jgi:hypothetical protein
VPTLSAVRELDFIESLKSKGITHQCRVKSVNAIVTRGRIACALNSCFKDGPFVRPFSWLSRSWRPVKRESSPSKFLSRHYDRLSTSRTIRRPPQSCPHSPAQCRRATAKNADWKGKCYQDVSTTRMTTYLLRGAAAMDRAFRNFRNGDAHFGPHPWPAPYIPNWAPIFTSTPLGNRQGCGLKKQVLCQQATGGKYKSGNHFALQGTTGLGACRDCQLYVDSGEPITLRNVDCDLRCSSGILVCGMNFFG